jgi:hypothetical protein
VPEEKEKEPKFKPDEDAEKYIAEKKGKKKKE